MINCSQNCCF